MAMHDGHRQRMRQRYLRAGLDGFDDLAILEFLLHFAIPRRDTNPIAHALLDRYGSLSAVLEAPAAALGPRWGDAYHMAVAGRAWLDFTLSDKGKGLRALCAALGVDLADTMAFGDNWNDVPMLDLAGAAYLMEGADPVLRERYPRRCANVMDALEALLAEDR